jgi:hypothetical protein
MNSIYRRNIFLLWLIFLTTAKFCSAQSLVNCTGQSISAGGYYFEYSIGEIAIQTIVGSDNHLTQGLLQPNLKVPDPSCGIINQYFQYFPNPTSDKLRLVGRNDWIESYQIFASDGKLVRHEKFYNNEINLISLAGGVYIVRLLPGCNGNYKTLKIIKTSK